MENRIQFNGTDLEYKLKRENRKTISIKIREGKIFVNADFYTDKKYIEQILLKNMQKILKGIDNTKICYDEGSTIKIFGKEYFLKKVYLNSEKPYIEIFEDKIIFYIIRENEDSQIEALLDNYYFQNLEQYLQSSFGKYKEITGLFPSKIYIKKMKSRFGSCSSKANISINLILAKYDKEIIDYVVLHELCHLKEMNHSKKFWNLVEKYMPDYCIIKNKLKN